MKVNMKFAAIVLAATGAMAATQASAQLALSPDGRTLSFKAPAAASASDAIDYANAKPMPLPQGRINPGLGAANASPVPGTPGVSAGAAGSGKQSPLVLPAPQNIHADDEVSPQEFGTSGQPYTTSRATAYNENTVLRYPFSAAGKLFFKINGSSYLCSASLIKPGVVVTAAHCVANYGAHQFYSAWQFVPAYTSGSAPYGVWGYKEARVLTAYYNGTDGCAQYGVICPDDVAVITLNGTPGHTTGWYGYGWNGYSYNGSSQALITQLGYPVALDGGLIMERTDSQGYRNAGLSNNTIIGSLMTGGSSGGPWLVNLGAPPSLSGTGFGTAANHNIVVGVTSWGYVSTLPKQQGAAPFTSGNIVVLVNTVCGLYPGNC